MSRRILKSLTIKSHWLSAIAARAEDGGGYESSRNDMPGMPSDILPNCSRDKQQSNRIRSAKMS